MCQTCSNVKTRPEELWEVKNEASEGEDGRTRKGGFLSRDLDVPDPLLLSCDPSIPHYDGQLGQTP